MVTHLGMDGPGSTQSSDINDIFVTFSAGQFNLVTFFEKSLGFSAKLHMVLRKDLAKFEPFLCKTSLV